MNDRTSDSDVVTVTLNVETVNDTPVAAAVSVSTNEDTSVEVTLNATDADNDTLTYVIVTQPTSGVLSAVNGNKVAYSSSNFSGTDSFTFKANDSDLDSNISRITLTVTNPADLNTGLVAHYAFEENGNDSSNNQFDATETNVSYISGVKGKAAHLANGNGLLTAFHDWPEMQNFTISMFVKLDEYASDVAQWPARNVFLSFDHLKGASLENALELALESEYSNALDRRYLSAHVVDEQELYSKVTTDGFLKQWTALTYVREGGQFKVYVNGQLFHNYDAPSTAAFTPANLVMGKNYRLLNQGLSLFGAMDELRIYSRAVSLSEVKALSKIEVVTATGKLNDTGITQCSNANGQGQSCPVTDYPNQDAQYGRDLHNNDDSDGHAGFSFTKLDANGNELLANAAAWSCVKDNVTGLIWEVKQGGNGVTGDEGLHDADDGFSWYSSTLGGFEESGYWDWGDEHGYGMAFVIRGAICHGYDLSDSASYCNTEAFVERVNQAGLCGAKDWRLPTREALRSIVSYGHTSAIDKTYFPQTKSNWSSSITSEGMPSRRDEEAWAAGGTNSQTASGYLGFGVRLVRGGQ